jgi:hypothetical protein
MCFRVGDEKGRGRGRRRRGVYIVRRRPPRTSPRWERRRRARCTFHTTLHILSRAAMCFRVGDEKGRGRGRRRRGVYIVRRRPPRTSPKWERRRRARYISSTPLYIFYPEPQCASGLVMRRGEGGEEGERGVYIVRQRPPHTSPKEGTASS